MEPAKHSSLFDYIDGADQSWDQLEKHLESVPYYTFEAELENHHGNRTWIEMSVTEMEGFVHEESRYLIVSREITERKYYERQMHRLAYYDTLGQLAADEFLKKTAATISDIVSGQGEAFRLGGDEFAVLISNIQTEQQVTELMNSLLSRFRQGYVRSVLEPRISRRTGMKIVQAIIQMGHNLGMKLVAEGTETAEQIILTLKDWRRCCQMGVNVIERNRVQVIGKGNQPILFAHGYGCDQAMWRFVTPGFLETYRVVLFDYVGSGKSLVGEYNFEKYNRLQGYAQDVLEIVDALELTDVIFIGHSISGMIGMLASIQKPEYFNRLIMIGSSPCYVNDPPGYFGGFDSKDIEELLRMMEMNFMGWASYLAPLAMNNPDRRELTDEIRVSFASGNPAIARQFAEVTFYADCRDELAKVTTLSLILHCSEDSIAPKAVGEYLHRNLKNSTLRFMEVKGHYPHLSHPQETIRLIHAYLKTI